MSRLISLPRWPRRWYLWIAAGLILRLAFIWFPRPGDDDTLDYLQLGHNLLHHGIYAMGSGTGLSPTMYRLPAYPIFLATFEFLFARLWPNTWLNAVFFFQTFADLAAGLLLAAFARRHLSDRAAEVTLALAMLCPFTAAYAAIAMTECFSVFAIALGLYAAGRALAAHASGTRDLPAVILAGLASALATLLRPDGIVLFASIGLGLFLYSIRGGYSIRSDSTNSLPGAKLSRPAFPSFACAAASPPHQSSASPLYCLSSLGLFAIGPTSTSFSRSRRVMPIPASHRLPVLEAGSVPGPLNSSIPPTSAGTFPETPSISRTFLRAPSTRRSTGANHRPHRRIQPDRRAAAIA